MWILFCLRALPNIHFRVLCFDIPTDLPSVKRRDLNEFLHSLEISSASKQTPELQFYRLVVLHQYRTC